MIPVACLSSTDAVFKKAMQDHAVLFTLCNDRREIKVHERYIVYQPERKRWAVYTNRQTHDALVGRFDHVMTAVFKARQRSW